MSYLIQESKIAWKVFCFDDMQAMKTNNFNNKDWLGDEFNDQ